MPGPITGSEAFRETLMRMVREAMESRSPSRADQAAPASGQIPTEPEAETQTVPAGVTATEIPTTVIDPAEYRTATNADLGRNSFGYVHIDESIPDPVSVEPTWAIMPNINYVDAARPLFMDTAYDTMASISFRDVHDGSPFEAKIKRKPSSSELVRDLQNQVSELSETNENLRVLLREILDDYQQIAAEGTESFSLDGDDIVEKLKKAIDGAYLPTSGMNRPTIEMIACKLAEAYNLSPQETIEMPMGRTARTWELFRTEASSIHRLIRNVMKDSREPRNHDNILWMVYLRDDGRQVAARNHNEAMSMMDQFLESVPRTRPVIAPWTGDAASHHYALGSQSSTASLVATYAMHYRDTRRTSPVRF